MLPGSLVFGGAPIGGLYAPVSDETAAATLAAAWDAGIRAFDTAPHYGVGLSEQRIGEFLAERRRAEFVVSTKVGRRLVPAAGPVEGADEFYGTPALSRVRDYSADGVLRSLEDSLRRLRLDRVDIALIHDPDEHMTEALDGAYPALARLRSDGVVGAIGVGVNSASARRMVRDALRPRLRARGRPVHAAGRLRGRGRCSRSAWPAGSRCWPQACSTAGSWPGAIAMTTPWPRPASWPVPAASPSVCARHDVPVAARRPALRPASPCGHRRRGRRAHPGRDPRRRRVPVPGHPGRPVDRPGRPPAVSVPQSTEASHCSTPAMCTVAQDLAISGS